ncbi:MAG: hypothetical protein ACFFF4_10605 [Candidatus Thorarchaeota archaeon]
MSELYAGSTYSACIDMVRKMIMNKQIAYSAPDILSKALSPIFLSIIQIIESKRQDLGIDAERFAQTLCFESSVSILESASLEHLILDLPLITRFIAGEAAVAYSIRGIVDALDEEHKVKRIAGAYLAALTYLILNAQIPQ